MCEYNRMEWNGMERLQQKRVNMNGGREERMRRRGVGHAEAGCGSVCPHRFRHGTGRGDDYVMRFLSSLLSAFRFGHFVSFDLI